MSFDEMDAGIKVFENILPDRWMRSSMDVARFIIAYDDFGGVLDVSRRVHDDKLVLAYILPKFASIEVVLQALSLFNEFDGFINVYCCDQLCVIGKRFSNEHISFYDISRESVIEADAVVTYSLQAIYFIKKRLPVLILGPCGIGGLVTPDNLPFHSQSGFMGRPGGVPGEMLPLMIWLEELRTLECCEDISAVLEQNKSFVENLAYCEMSNVPSEANRRLSYFLMERDPKCYWNLVPRYCSNIRRINSGNIVSFKRVEINDTIVSVPFVYSSLLDCINGINKTADIFFNSGMNEDEFIELLDALIELKVITFCLLYS